VSSTLLVFFGTFLASSVEAVEALTIVLAVGVVRGWRSTLVGVGAAAIVLGAIVAALGPALQLIPISTLRFVVGALLLAFGLQWLRKAILRAAGYRPQRDEAAAFARERADAGAAPAAAHNRMDWYAFTVSFKGVLLEGLEVAFIVVSFGSTQSRLGLAAGAAAAAVVLVVAVGLLVRGPLERVPENSLKYVVGLLLTSFGVFWGGEGAGVEWPGADLAILGILAFLSLVSYALTRELRRRRLTLSPVAASSGDSCVRSVSSGGTSSSATTGGSPLGSPAGSPSPGSWSTMTNRPGGCFRSWWRDSSSARSGARRQAARR
jgi:uncharacterized membrane protein